MARKLSAEEEQVVRQLANGLAEAERQQLLADLADCTVVPATEDGARLQFTISGYQRPPYHGQHSYTVGGSMEDADGTAIGVNLYADENHRILELELIRWGDGPLLKPNWSSFRVQY
ncbi:MAG: hypothetical protein V4609_05320 [Pseudomonadota bacterium]